LKVGYCIFCRGATKNEPVEHIALEGLFGHQPFTSSTGIIQSENKNFLVLDKDQTCGGCNGIFKKPDEYLQEQLGLLKVLWNEKGTKHGKPAKVERPGFYAVRRPDGPYIALNTSTKKIFTEDGIAVHPAKNHPRAIRLKRFTKQGMFFKASVEQPIRMNKLFVRALHKIAFELLCFNQGPEYVLDHRFDPVREYIRYGSGYRCILFDKGPNDIREVPTLGLWQYGTQDWLAGIAFFFVDLSPENYLFEKSDMNKRTEENFIKWSDKDGN
jgi:hypothetical protein